jgi:chemotaxis protein CheC
MTSPVALSDLERDALTELVNIGFSRAATGLRKMVGDQVLLSVPSLDVITRKTAAALIEERENDDLVAVRQDFSGPFSGRALLILPQLIGLDLVRAVVGEEMASDELADIEHEALAEIGNVILNGCLATMANMLQQSLVLSLPEVLRGNGAQLFEIEGHEADDQLVLFLFINFSVQARDIRGYIAMLMDLPALATLKGLISDFIARVMNDDANVPGTPGAPVEFII